MLTWKQYNKSVYLESRSSRKHNKDFHYSRSKRNHFRFSTCKTLGKFSARVKEIMGELSVETIKIIIGSMNSNMYWYGTEGSG